MAESLTTAFTLVIAVPYASASLALILNFGIAACAPVALKTAPIMFASLAIYCLNHLMFVMAVAILIVADFKNLSTMQ